MSNTIELAKSFVPKLDECYRLASLTSVLDGAPELAKQGANANELIIPMMSISVCDLCCLANAIQTQVIFWKM